MALEGLCLVKDESRSTNKNLNFRYPKPGAMLDYILKQQPKLLDSSEIREQKLVFPSKVYVAMIQFLLKCFESELEHNNSLERSCEFLSSVKAMKVLLSYIPQLQRHLLQLYLFFQRRYHHILHLEFLG